MKVIVTGAAGFLGKTVLKHLLDAGHSVKALVRSKAQVDAIKEMDVQVVKGDILRPASLERAIEGCEVVMHLASIYTFYPWWDSKASALYKINVEGTRRLLEMSLKNGIKKFIFASSVASIGKRRDGKPSNEETIFNGWHRPSHYARSKLLAEYEVLKFCAQGLPAVILNPAIIIGQGDAKPTPSGEIILNFLNRRYPFYIDCRLCVADVDDVARAFVSAIQKGRSGHRYILCNKKSYRLDEILKILESIAGIPRPGIKIPYRVLHLLACLEELFSFLVFKKKPLISSEGVRFCNESLAVQNKKAQNELDYGETSIEETFAKSVNWYKENGYVKNKQAY
ncbi:SDR family oxidoreductase [Candidatus Omnitrophota bacterium]